MRFSQSCLAVAIAALATTLPKVSAVDLRIPRPLAQDLFNVEVPNALDSSFIYPSNSEITVQVKPGTTFTGLVDANGTPLETPIWGYASPGQPATWPGKTFVAKENQVRKVIWENKLPIGSGEPGHLITGLNGEDVIDKSLHWVYSIMGYTNFTTEKEGVPIVTHLHGGHSESASDGNPVRFIYLFVDSVIIVKSRTSLSRFCFAGVLFFAKLCREGTTMEEEPLHVCQRSTSW